MDMMVMLFSQAGHSMNMVALRNEKTFQEALKIKKNEINSNAELSIEEKESECKEMEKNCNDILYLDNKQLFLKLPIQNLGHFNKNIQFWMNEIWKMFNYGTYLTSNVNNAGQRSESHKWVVNLIQQLIWAPVPKTKYVREERDQKGEDMTNAKLWALVEKEDADETCKRNKNSKEKQVHSNIVKYF